MRCFDHHPFALKRLRNMPKSALLITTLFLASCAPPIKVNAPPPPADWLQCAPEPERPKLAPLNGIAGIYAKPEVDARDSLIARYILALRAAHFDCANQLGKVRDYHAAAE